MDFVLTLHGHLPYVLHHGRWPHGSVWLSEAAFDSYLPLIEELQKLKDERVASPITLGLTPVLANQLAHPSFVSEFEAYMERRLESAAGALSHLEGGGSADAALVPVATFWQDRLTRMLALFRSLDGDLISAFRSFEQQDRIELISSAATHGFLPLLARDESIKLQLAVGVAEHKRLFGRAPTGCWLPECAYRPGGPWGPPAAGPERARAYRPGLDEHLTAAGYRYFFVDSHLVRAGAALGYPDVNASPAIGERTPYVAYRVASSDRRAQDLFAFVRDPKASAQVWSRAEGYPGDEWYLEFHKIRWPDGLRLWRVTGSGVDLGAKQQYDPRAADNSARNHAAHFASVLEETARQVDGQGQVITAPFDAELFGHWWFEGVDFLAQLYRRLSRDGVRPVTARQHVASVTQERPTIQLTEGSWGKDGNFSMWLNDQTAWTWQRLWPLEEAFWAVAPKALAGEPKARAVLAQATRSMLLAQASDWQFIISTGEAGDYATQRFDEHCAQAEDLVRALAHDKVDDATLHRVEALAAQDSVFPNVLDSVAEALK
jgi:1,4-alpha-glucan branching enzyme